MEAFLGADAASLPGVSRRLHHHPSSRVPSQGGLRPHPHQWPAPRQYVPPVFTSNPDGGLLELGALTCDLLGIISISYMAVLKTKLTRWSS